MRSSWGELVWDVVFSRVGGWLGLLEFLWCENFQDRIGSLGSKRFCFHRGFLTHREFFSALGAMQANASAAHAAARELVIGTAGTLYSRRAPRGQWRATERNARATS